MLLLPQQSLNITGDAFRLGGGKVAFDHLALAVNQEFGEVPLDAPAHATAFLGLEPSVERVGLVAVNFYLGKAWESGLVVEATEVIDFLSGSRGLALELVAREVQDGEALVAVAVVEGLQALVLGREATAGGGVDN